MYNWKYYSPQLKSVIKLIISIVNRQAIESPQKARYLLRKMHCRTFDASMFQMWYSILSHQSIYLVLEKYTIIHF